MRTYGRRLLSRLQEHSYREMKKDLERWFASAMKKKEFKDRPYLEYTKYESLTYIDLKKIVRIVEFIENYTSSHGFNRSKVDVLDIGCGIGNMSLCLAGLGYHVTGVDINEGEIGKAKERATGFNLDPRQFRVAEAKDYLKVCGRAFNFVLALDVLEHLEQPQELCEGVYRALTTPGFFILSVPNGWGLGEICIWGPARAIREILKIPVPPGGEHLQRFTLRKIEKTLRDAGFKYKYISAIDFCPTSIPFLQPSNRSWLTLYNLRVADLVPKSIAYRWVVAGIKANPEKDGEEPGPEQFVGYFGTEALGGELNHE